MTAILGLSCFYHDSAAAIVVDGEIVAAAQEERFTRKKHDDRFPRHAVQYCLEAADLTLEQIDYVGFYEKPLLKFDRLLQTYIAYAPRGFRSFAAAMPVWLKQKLHLPRLIHRELEGKYHKRIVFPRHHESHAASAFFPSPFEQAAILTVDGVGEWSTASLGTGTGNRLQLTHELRFPHSLGMLYSAFTYYCGFKVNSGEYKLMGLAPYGEPVYADLIRERLLDLKPDGSFRMDMSYFQYCEGLTMTSRKFARLFGQPRRTLESELTTFHMNLAASVQKVTEEILLKMTHHLHELTGQTNLCLAGGVALNCVANRILLEQGPFEKLWIQPAAGDAGGALGVSLLIAHQLLDQPRTVNPNDSQQASLLGPEFSSSDALTTLRHNDASFVEINNEEELLQRVARLLAEGNVVGWMQGRMEFGPRALGCRSILGDPRDPQMQSRMNRKIKFRESFRPFAPAVLQERTRRYFDFPEGDSSPYMLITSAVHSEAGERPATETGAGFERLRQIRSGIPAVTHVDQSARLQTVGQAGNPRFYNLLKEFEHQTGCAVLINTSFNVRGEPLVCTPEDAWHCFMNTDMDVLVIDNLLLLKKDQPEQDHTNRNSWLTQFELD